MGTTRNMHILGGCRAKDLQMVRPQSLFLLLKHLNGLKKSQLLLLVETNYYIMKTMYYTVPVVVNVGLLSNWTWPAIRREDGSCIHIFYKLLCIDYTTFLHLFFTRD